MWRGGTGAERQAVILARTAIAEGLDALTVGDLKLARRWLERAHRLVPHDANATLALAFTYLTQDPVLAAMLFRSVTDVHDVRQAWVGLAAARLRTDGPEAAEQPLAVALARHAFAPDVTSLANAVGLRPGKPGWCALKPNGQLLIQARVPSKLRLLVDGTAISGTELPPRWEDRRTIDIQLGDVPLLGSPIEIRAIRRVAGCVEVYDGGIRGWAWCPADPETPPVLTIRQPTQSGQQIFIPQNQSTIVPGLGPLARPRSFTLNRADLLEAAGPVYIQGRDGADLLGSPLNPFIHVGPFPAPCPSGVEDSAAPPDVQDQVAVSSSKDRRSHDVTIVIPVHDGSEAVLACLAGVLASVLPHTRIVVVDDASSQPAVIEALDNLARGRKITLLRHCRPKGFSASANAGILISECQDVVLLSSDVLVPPGWVERLRATAYASHDIGTVTPLSNNAGILSYPGGSTPTPALDQEAANRLDRLAQRANGGGTVDIPSGTGFCLYVRRECLSAAGLFRPDLFAQGYGDVEDFCLRARKLGWRSVALTGLFVGCAGGLPRNGAAVYLDARNRRIVEQRHPCYRTLTDRFRKSDPLAGMRRRIDRLIWRQRLREWRHPVILITHHDGGGVEQRLVHAVARHAAHGCDAIVLRPTEAASGDAAIAVHDGLTEDLPNLIYTMPRELPSLIALLRLARPEMIEVHHLASHQPVIYDLIRRLSLPYTVHVHDYSWFCPRISLIGNHDRYCGEPDVSGCATCVRNNGHFLAEDITVAALRDRSAAFLQAAQLVVVPSEDASIRMRRYFNRLTTLTIPHENDAPIAADADPAQMDCRSSDNRRLSVCIPGAIGVHKGFHVLLACASDAAKRDLDLEFVVAGHTIDDARMIATGRVFITGQFKPHEAVALISAQQAHLGFVPSVCPETWCLSLGDIWRAGLAVAAFNIGAQAERIRRHGQGTLLPLGLPASDINDTLIAAIRTSNRCRAYLEKSS